MTELETTRLIIAGTGALAAFFEAVAITILAIGIWSGVRALNRTTAENEERRRREDARAP